MTNETDSMNTAASTTWQLNALTEALGDLTLTVSDSLSIGRGSDNDVVLGSKQVSRNHAVLSVLDGQLYVKDLDSSNGTFINEQRIAGNESSHLKANDTLGFASFSFQVQASAAPITMSESDTLAPVVTEEPVADTHENVDAAAVTETPASEPVTEEQIVEESVLEESASKETLIEEEPIIEQTGNEPVIKETGIEEMLPATDDTVPVEPLPVDAGSDMTEESVTPTHETVEPVVEEPVFEESAVEEVATEEAVATEPVVKETGIDEVLSDADAASPTPVEETPVATEGVDDTSVPTATETEAVTSTESSHAASTDSAPVVEEQPAVHEEPVMHEKPVMHEEPAVQDEHDKTTKTELQEEADPEVLKAKQAASAQFSGTANLGQPRDLGTEGNNAMDQEISNPAHAGHVEKKASGGWFIWVFVTILIIGLALWLFNMGGA